MRESSGVKPLGVTKVKPGGNPLGGAPPTNPDSLRTELSKSVDVGTRKMVNYA